MACTASVEKFLIWVVVITAKSRVSIATTWSVVSIATDVVESALICSVVSDAI